MNKIIAKLFVAILMTLFIVPSVIYAQENNDSLAVNIIIVYNIGEDEKQMCFEMLESDVSPYIVDGTTMIPLRALSEAFGYNVDYQEKDKKITIHDGSEKNELIFWIDSTSAFKNGQADTMLQSPVIRDNRAFIPLRYVSESFNKYVTWKKDFYGNTMLIWISSVQLLTDDDVAVERDNNYYNEAALMDPTYQPYYRLKNDGQTFRGIKIGDKYEKVVELYGEPHAKEFKNVTSYWVEYYNEGYPNSGDVRIITFYIVNGIVEYVGI